MATIRTAIQVDDRMSGAFRSITNAMNITISAFSDLQEATHNAVDVSSIEAARAELSRAEVTLNQVESSIQSATQNQRQFNDSIEATNPQANILLGKFRQIATAVGGIIGLQKAIELSDSMAQTDARLSLIVDDGGSVDELQQKIYNVAQNTRAPFMKTADMIAKLGLQASKSFASNDELLFFAEQLNKSFVVAGTSVQGVESVMLQLTQAMAAGKLQGEELNAVLDNAQPIVANIQKYLEEVQNIDASNIKQLASDGVLTAEIIKNAMFYAADETNAKFESMPITFGQAMTTIKNDLLMTIEPMLQVLAEGATLLHDNWSTLEPVFWGLSAAMGSFALMTGIQAGAAWLAVAANRALIATMLANPLMWIAVLIGVVVAAIYKWVQAVGGLKIAWMIVSAELMYQWDLLKVNFLAVVYGICGLVDNLVLAWQDASVGVQNWCGDMRAGALRILQDMTNGAVDIINGFINTLNKIPGVAIETIDYVTYAATFEAQNEAEKQARNAALAATKASIYEEQQRRQEKVAKMAEDAQTLYNERIQAVINAQNEVAKGAEDNSTYDYGAYESTLGDIDKNTGKTADNTETSTEDLKYLRDIAERETINRFTTAEIKVDMGGINNTVNNMNDLDGIADYLAAKVEEQMQIAAEGIHE